MICTRIAKGIAMIALLCAFCIGTAFSSDAAVALRGTYGRNGESGRQLANEKISVYRCDSENRTITSTISNKTEELAEFGFDIRICFEATNRAISNDIYILKIDDFVFTKDRTSGDLAAAGPTRKIPVMIRQAAVDHGVAMSTDFTEIYCNPGVEICAIETRLTGYFFLTSGIIRGKGSMMMQRGKDARRELQHMDEFEDVYIELDFTGGGRAPTPPKKKTIIITAGIVVAVLLLLCCSGMICFFMGICCFANRDKKEEDTDDDDLEDISINIQLEKSTKKSNKGSSDDSSETESLEDDKYWDDDIHISDDENASAKNSKESNILESDGASDVPSHTAEVAPRNSNSERRSSLYDFGAEDWDAVILSSEGGNNSIEKSFESHDTNEVTPNHEDVQETPQKRKSEKRTSENRKSERRKSERRNSEKSERRKSNTYERRNSDTYERRKSEKSERRMSEKPERRKSETGGRSKSEKLERRKSEKSGRRKSDTYEKRKSEKSERRRSDTYERRKSERSERRKSMTTD